MSSNTHHLPRSELELRWERCRRGLAGSAPGAGGLLVFSRLNIYYFTGTMASGLFWLPLEGKPVLLCRRGQARAGIESPVELQTSFRSFREVPALISEAGDPLPGIIAAEMNGLSWSLSRSLMSHLDTFTFLEGDVSIALARSIKSEWELQRIRTAGSRHAMSLLSLLPPFLAPGMTEMEIAHRIWEIFLGQGHQGMLRMGGYGEEVFLGHVSAADSANYPSVFNGPVGVRGGHPAAPFMGSPVLRWEKNSPLTVDVGFGLEGYVTDKTQVYWSGPLSSVPDDFRAAHDFCVEVQHRMAERLLPGSRPADIAADAFDLAGRRGWSEGFMALGANKVPFVGHGIGLAIDEYPVIAKGFDTPLEEGMVIALEPKIGIAGVGMAGVENTYEVTGRGGRCLTGQDFSILPLTPG